MKKLIVGISAEGSVILLEGQLKYFKDAGYQTYLLAPRSERSEAFCEREECILLPIKIEREISVWKDIKSLFQIIAILKSIKPDIVNLGTPKVSLLGMIAARILKVPNRIYTCRGFRFEHEQGIKRSILIYMEKISSSFAHKVICISPSVKEFGLQNRIFDKCKAVVINKGSSNGFDLAKFNPAAVNENELATLKTQLGLGEKFVFGFVGRIVDRKGINELNTAFKRLAEKYNNLHLVIVGGVEDVQITDKSLLDKMRKTPGITFTGPQKNVPLYISLFNVFVLPAWWEGFGNVLVQAAAMGVPVISTTGTGTRDAVADGFNGLLVEPKNTDALYDAMENLYLNTADAKRLGTNGIEWAKNFDSNIIWEGMNEIYQCR